MAGVDPTCRVCFRPIADAGWRTRLRPMKCSVASSLFLLFATPAMGASRYSSVDTAVHKVMTTTGAMGRALAIIDGGRVHYVQAYGVRNAQNEPLRTDTVMYGASLTKTVFAYTALQLVDQRKLSL